MTDYEKDRDTVETALRLRLAEVERERDASHELILRLTEKLEKATSVLLARKMRETSLSDIAMQTKAQWDSQIAMTVARLGGTVEGAPTHAGNFLQRIDALREIESQASESRDVAKREKP